MSPLPIIIAPDQRLKRPASPVKSVNSQIRGLMDDMLETMYEAPGIGLAAPQVGVSVRVLVIDINMNENGVPGEPLLIANPQLMWASQNLRATEEGCLSLPTQYSEVERPAQVRVTFTDKDNQTKEIEADGLLAACLQHEMDHLDGILFVDHLSHLKRNMILKKLAKNKRHNQ
ncbi:MAG: peptide deformylase [Pseudomonadota bacterium]|nr:peptide deformylase [Pseudomonadota bacterium]